MYNRIKRFVAAMLVVACTVLPIQVSAADSGAGTMLESKRTFIAPGLTSYARSYGESDGMRQRAFSLELSPNSDVYPIVMACDTIWGGMTMDAIIGYAEQMGYHVVGAVNTAFFYSPGVPIGIAVENGLLRASDDGLNAFAIMEDGSYYIARDPETMITLSNEAWGGETISVDDLNKRYHDDRLHLYSSAYSTVSTRVDEDETVWAVRLLIDEGTLKLNGTLRFTVTEVLPATHAVPIGDEYMILTGSAEGPHADLWQRFAVGDRVTVQIQCNDEKLAQAKYITGCGDILVENGRIADDTDWMHHIGGPNPRTMVGWRADGTLVMYVAEGRNPGVADGLTLQMAAEEMLRQGCTFAVNMDGGGSSVIGVRRPGAWMIEALNYTSDGGQRQCASYILLVTDQTSDGVAQYWHLKQNGMRVLPGQRVYLSVFGTDTGLYPAVNAPQQIIYADEKGLLEENCYTAPEAGGSHRITMWGSGAFGEGSIHVISEPTVLKIVDDFGRKPNSVILEQGERLELKVIASHNGKPIPADHTVLRYEMSAPLGKADADGVFIADALAGTTGTLTMHIGSYTQQLQVTVVNSRTDASQHRMKTALDFLGLAG